MRILKLVVVLVALSLCIPAHALTIPNVPNGPLWLEVRDWDNGALYAAYISDGGGGSVIESGVAIPQNTFTVVNPATFQFNVANKVIGRWKLAPSTPYNEDAYGIFQILTMSSGVPVLDDAFGTNTGVPFSKMDMDKGGQDYYVDRSGVSPTVYTDTQLLGVFSGLKDGPVTLNADGTWSLTASGLDFELWAIPLSDMGSYLPNALPDVDALPTGSGGDRQSQTRYANWIDSFQDGVGATGVQLLGGTSTAFSFAGINLGTFQGSNTMYLDVDENVGVWGERMNVEWWDNVPGIPVSDIRMTWQTDNTNYMNWAVSSTDEAGLWVVPEPMTLLAVFLGSGSLAGYVRKRRRA